EIVANVPAGHITAALWQHLIEDRGLQRLRHDNEATHRRHPASEPSKRTDLGRSSREQYLPGFNDSARTCHPVGSAGHRIQAGDRSRFVYQRTLACGRLRQPDTEFAHVHLGARALDEPTVESFRAYFLADAI